jgi:hypothetical protein
VAKRALHADVEKLFVHVTRVILGLLTCLSRSAMVLDQCVVNASVVTGPMTVNTRMARAGLGHICWNKTSHVFKLEYRNLSIPSALRPRLRYTILTHFPTSHRALMSHLVSSLPSFLRQYHLHQVGKPVSIYKPIITLSHHCSAPSSSAQTTWSEFSTSSWWDQEEPPSQIVLES